MQSHQHDKIFKQAFEFRDGLTVYAYALTRDWSLAQDAFQEALIALHHRIDDIDPEQLFYWLKKVTRNKAVSIIRKQESLSKTHKKLSDLVDSQFELHLSQEFAEQSKIERVALHQCMNNIRSDARELLLAFYRDQQSCVQLSKIYNRSVNALHLLLSRTRKSLKICIKKQLSELEVKP